MSVAPQFFKLDEDNVAFLVDPVSGEREDFAHVRSKCIGWPRQFRKQWTIVQLRPLPSKINLYIPSPPVYTHYMKT